MRKYLISGFIVMILFILFAFADNGNYIPEKGCWVYPDKLICISQSQVNTTVFIKNVSCYSTDVYGTGNLIQLPCIANGEMRPTTVEVCYKLLPYENGNPRIEEYNPRYNCKNETWEGEVQLHIPREIIPWECNEEEIDNVTTACFIEPNADYVINGMGNDVNGTKVIYVNSIESPKIRIDLIIGGIIGLAIVILVYRRTKKSQVT